MIKKIIKKLLAHKFISLILIAVLAYGGYYGYQKLHKDENGAVSYRTEAVEKGTITVSVSGTGQVSVSNQVDLKPEASGKVTYLGVVNGQEVKTGTLIAQLDSSDALRSVRDAETNLESAKLSLEKLLEPTDQLTILQAENALVQAKETKTGSETDLIEVYDDGFNSVANAFLDLPSVMTGLEEVIYGNSFENSIWNIDYYIGKIDDYDDKANQYKDGVVKSYNDARDKYELNFENYKDASRYSDEQTIEDLISETYESTKAMAESIKKMSNLIDIYQDLSTQYNVDIPSGVAVHKNNLQSYTGTTNGHINNLLSIRNSINNKKETIINAQRDIEEKTIKLADLKDDPDPLDIRSQQITIEQRQNSLLQAQQKLADYSVRAPFDGVAVEVDTRIGESVSSGTVLATLITQQKIAEITLNEIDVAQVKISQKVILTFDAVEGLSITGEVVEIDALGTVTQGVVSYGVKIAFDVQDERIKPGMSMSANIIVESKREVLSVPINAVKTVASSSYVEVLVNGLPQRKTVTTGLSNDTKIEIIDGISEGEQIITQTINNGVTSQTNSSQSNQPNSSQREMFRIMH